MTELTDLKWKRIVAGGIAPHVVSIGVLVVAIVGYTFVVAFGIDGGPWQGSLTRFTATVSTWVFPAVTILATAAAAAWVTRRTDSDAALAHGLAVGALVAVTGLAFGALDAAMAVRFVATVAAGAVGGSFGPALANE